MRRNTVSIHAPARGATTPVTGLNSSSGVSIHAPARGATRLCSRLYHGIRCFNPRTREGCDCALLFYTSYSSLFQSTHPRGVRLLPVGCHFYYSRFQSTHPRGVRLRVVLPAALFLCFNPRTREGCDHTEGHHRLLHPGFNPRTREGCDATSSACRSCSTSFNPRTREGCDLG